MKDTLFIKFSPRKNRRLYRSYTKEEIDNYLLPKEYLDAKGYTFEYHAKYRTWVYQIHGVYIPVGLIPMAMHYIKKEGLNPDFILSDEEYLSNFILSFIEAYGKYKNIIKYYNHLMELCHPEAKYFEKCVFKQYKDTMGYILDEENSIGLDKDNYYYKKYIHYLNKYTQCINKLEELKKEKYGKLNFKIMENYFYFFRVPGYLSGVVLDSFKTHLKYLEMRLKDYEEKYHFGKEYHLHENPVFMYTREFEF